MRDPYDVLGVGRSASEAEVKRAYRKLAKQYHPDKHAGDKQAQAKFSEINSAYEILGDKEKRGKFDRGEIDAEGKPKFQGFEGFRARPGRRRLREHRPERLRGHLLRASAAAAARRRHAQLPLHQRRPGRARAFRAAPAASEEDFLSLDLRRLGGARAAARRPARAGRRYPRRCRRSRWRTSPPAGSRR